MKWHGPSIQEAVAKCARNNCWMFLCLVPISFTCEHLETLHELDLEAKELARLAGILERERIPHGRLPSFVYRRPGSLDAEGCRDWAQEREKCTMDRHGGGVAGLTCAWQLQKHGKDRSSLSASACREAMSAPRIIEAI